MTQSLGGFFAGGGGRGINWPDNPPATVTGTVTVVHPPEEILDLKDKKPTGKFQVRIGLATAFRNFEMCSRPDDPAEVDDGARTLYVKSWMRGAIGDALRKVNKKEPEIDGRLTVTFVKTEPPTGPGLSASKHFEAVYEPPAASAGFFGGDQAVAATNGAAAGPPKPEGIPQAAWDVMDAATKAAIVGAASGPAKPEGIDQKAWDAMDAQTKQAVASTVASLPPF